jgi:hypothetical protein
VGVCADRRPGTTFGQRCCWPIEDLCKPDQLDAVSYSLVFISLPTFCIKTKFLNGTVHTSCPNPAGPIDSWAAFMATAQIPAPKAQASCHHIWPSMSVSIVRSTIASMAAPPVTHATVVVMCVLSRMGRWHMVRVTFSNASVYLTVHNLLTQA